MRSPKRWRPCKRSIQQRLAGQPHAGDPQASALPVEGIPVRIGVNLGPTADRAALLAAAQSADALGYDALGLLDHYHAPNPEWRYLAAGDAMPWYPSISVIRQRDGSDWQPVIAVVAGRLRAIVEAWKTRCASVHRDDLRPRQ